ncbi:MAG TPA: SgcJ/EcaC family oxidoreductase [Nitrospira sp.]|nr:SgcJ/EcaC family oxidoreductase [Nitrospira sp.]
MSEQRDEQDIRDLVSAWMDATKAGEIEKVLSLMSDDVVFLMPGQPPMGTAGFAAAARAQAVKDAPKFNGTSEIQEITVVGDWAFMWTKLTLVVTPSDGGPSMTRAGHTLSVLKKHQGKWVLARDANMLTPVTS